MTTPNTDISILSGCMDLHATAIADIATITAAMEPLDDDKQLVLLDEDDKRELATIIMVKGGMSSLGKKAKEMEERVKEVGAPWMLARGVKTVKIPGIGTLSLSAGKNVSISQDNLRKVLIKYLPADKVAKVLSEVVKETTYTTLQFKV